MSTYQDPFRLPVQYQLNANWGKSSSSSSEESGKETHKQASKKLIRKKIKRKSKKLEMHLVPPGEVPAVASPSPSPPPVETICIKNNKLCEEYRVSGTCKNTHCFEMHSEFPCKFYYLGLDCPDGQECRLLHKAEFLSSDMKYALLNHIFKSRPEVLGEEFFNFKKTNSIQEIVTKLEKRISEFPLAITGKIVYVEEKVEQVEEPVDMRVSWSSILYFYFTAKRGI